MALTSTLRVSAVAPGSTEPVTKDPLSGVVSRSAGDAAARMRPRAAEVEALDWRGVPGQERRRAQEAQLVERGLTVKDRSADEAEELLEVRWR